MDYTSWINKTNKEDDRITISPIWGFYDVLNKSIASPKSGDSIPPGSHWCFFQPHVPMDKVGVDGHPKRGSFMPDPPDLPRRMFAGAKIIFDNEIKIDDIVSRVQTIKSINEKIGQSGKLLFVNLEEKYFVNNKLCITQLSDIVYREAPDLTAKSKSQNKIHKDLDKNINFFKTKKISPDPVMLFKYSAITFNGHRIHYDRKYAETEEGYPGLIVHGPLTATLLMNFCIEIYNKRIEEFKFRALKPIFDIEKFTINATKKNSDNIIELSAINTKNEICMAAFAKIS
mgnify:CR=1 FL=1